MDSQGKGKTFIYKFFFTHSLGVTVQKVNFLINFILKVNVLEGEVESNILCVYFRIMRVRLKPSRLEHVYYTKQCLRSGAKYNVLS